jgi:hypothetical protein
MSSVIVVAFALYVVEDVVVAPDLRVLALLLSTTQQMNVQMSQEQRYYERLEECMQDVI